MSPTPGCMGMMWEVRRRRGAVIILTLRSRGHDHRHLIKYSSRDQVVQSAPIFPGIQASQTSDWYSHHHHNRDHFFIFGNTEIYLSIFHSHTKSERDLRSKRFFMLHAYHNMNQSQSSILWNACYIKNRSLRRSLFDFMVIFIRLTRIIKRSHFKFLPFLIKVF